MKPASCASLFGIVLAAGCTIDFDRFDFTDSDAMGGVGAAGRDGAAKGGVSGGDANTAGKGGASASGGDAAVDASLDATDGGCPTGQKRCGTECVPDDDPARGCGATSCTPCALSNATARCEAGACAIGTCSTDFDDCDTRADNGCEVDLKRDPDNCGRCTTRCAPPMAMMCSDGTCTQNPCPTGFGECDANLVDFCETNLSTSSAHCGMCNRACSPPNATGTCVGGACRIQTCNAGFADCDNDPATGCEINLSTNTAHCGACNAACQVTNNSARTCAGGLCGYTCNTGFADCNGPDPGASDDGCEVDTRRDPQNCNACGSICNSTNGTATCTAGVCGIGCNPTFGNCDNSALNGCETSLSTNVSHCGGCGRACGSTNVMSRACSAGTCSSTCNLGFGNCSAPAAPAADNGCETNVSGNDTSCGGCNNSCDAQSTGGGGLVCGPPANSCGCDGSNARCRQGGAGGFCDSTDRCRCGGVLCRAGEACIRVNGNNVCSCNTGAACTGTQVCCQTPAGCRDIQDDAANCGACGHACPTGFACQAGQCRCTASAQCNAGGGGTCNTGTGLCACGATTCALGRRCQPGGVCG